MVKVVVNNRNFQEIPVENIKDLHNYVAELMVYI